MSMPVRHRFYREQFPELDMTPDDRRNRWMIYGAYGATGRMIAHEAVRRGHHPLLAGRDGEQLSRFASELGLESLQVDLADAAALETALGGVDLVVHAAGPFTITADPMQRACLQAGTNYIDITGELPVFVETYGRHRPAVDRGICLVSGCGFDVVPSDAVAAGIARRLPSVRDLLLVIDSNTTPTGGTVASAVALAGEGGSVRRDGRLVRVPLLSGHERLELPWGRRTIVPMPLGDLESAARSTGASSITTALALPSAIRPLLRVIAPLFRVAARSKWIRSFLGRRAHRLFTGPTAEQMSTLQARIWGRGRDDAGRTVELWITVVEPYRFTAEVAVRAAERILAERPIGALTPSQAFGPDFPLEIEGSSRTIGS